MSLFKRKTRATRRAEARAIKAKAKLEARLAAKNEARRIKADHRAETKALKAQLRSQRDSDRAAVKVAETQLKAAKEGKLLSPTRIRRVLTVSRLLAPIVVPLVYRAAIAARGFVDERRADRLGVPLSQIGQFSGHGAQLSARIAGAEHSLALVAEKKPKDAETKQFVAAITERLHRPVGRRHGRREHARAAPARRARGDRRAARRHRRRSDGTARPGLSVNRVVATVVLAMSLIVMAVAGAGAASAHATRVATDPVENTELSQAPQKVSATFNETLQPQFAAMTVVGPDGNLWSAGDPQVAGAVVSVGVRPLGPSGTYTVNYRVTSADGHVVSGSWSFRLTVASTGTPGPSASATNPSGDGIPVWPFFVAAGVIVAAGAYWAVRRQR